MRVYAVGGACHERHQVLVLLHGQAVRLLGQHDLRASHTIGVVLPQHANHKPVPHLQLIQVPEDARRRQARVSCKHRVRVRPANGKRRAGHVTHAVQHAIAGHAVIDGQVNAYLWDHELPHHAIAGQVERRKVLLVGGLPVVGVKGVSDYNATSQQSVVEIAGLLPLRAQILRRRLLDGLILHLGDLGLLHAVEVVACVGVQDCRKPRDDKHRGKKDADTARRAGASAGRHSWLCRRNGRGDARDLRRARPPSCLVYELATRHERLCLLGILAAVNKNSDTHG